MFIYYYLFVVSLNTKMSFVPIRNDCLWAFAALIDASILEQINRHKHVG